jgi:hypothetical protein
MEASLVTSFSQKSVRTGNLPFAPVCVLSLMTCGVRIRGAVSNAQRQPIFILSSVKIAGVGFTSSPDSDWRCNVHEYLTFQICTVWLACMLSFILGLPSLGSSVAFSAATSIATIGLYISYGMHLHSSGCRCLI